MFAIRWAVFLLAAVPAVAAEPAPLKRWAVVASPRVQATGLPDLVTAELSQAKDVELVERADIAAVTKELALTRTLTADAIAERRALGGLVRADALLLLDDGPEKGQVRIVMCDCRTGARLGSVVMAGKVDKAPAALLAEQVGEMRERYKGGIVTIIGLTPFLCNNLTHEHDQLQAIYTELLASALTTRPGVAVLEIDEARALLAEQELVGAEKAGRPAPVLVEGEYTLSKPKEGGPVLAMKVRITSGGKPRPVVEKAALPVADAAKFLGTELPAEVLTAAAGPGLPIERQFALLVARADRFAKLGAFATANRLREAAILLKPEALDQRTLLIDQYCRQKEQVESVLYAKFGEGRPHKPSPADVALLARVSTDCLNDWRHALPHLDALIRSQAISLKVALSTYDRLMSVAWFAMQKTDDADLASVAAVAEPIRRDFVRQTFPLMLKLIPGTPPRGEVFRPYSKWQRAFVGTVVDRFDQHHNSNASSTLDKNWTREDLDYTLDLAREIERLGPKNGTWPDGSAVGGALLEFVQIGSARKSNFWHYTVRFTDADYEAFLKALEGSKNPLDAATGKLGRAWRDWNAGGKTPDLEQAARKQAEALAALDTPAKSLHVEIVGRQSTSPTFIQPTPTTSIEPARPSVPAFYSFLDVQVKELAGRVVPLSGKGWKVERTGAPRPPSPQQLLRCGDAFDLFRTEGAVLFHREAGRFDEVLVDPAADFCTAAWDGRHAWIGSTRKGIWVIEPNGKTVARIEGDPLPPADRGMLMHPLGAGRMLVAGSFGEFGRGWIAVVERVESGGKVKLLLEAKNVWSAKGAAKTPVSDVYWSFLPTQLSPQPGGKVLVWRKVSFMGNDGTTGGAEQKFTTAMWSQPLLVDVAAETVTVAKLPAGLAKELERGPNPPPYMSDGTAFFYGKLFPPSGSKPLPLCRTSTEELISWKGSHYSIDRDVFRIDDRTHATRWLFSQPLTFSSRFGASVHYGPVAWSNGEPFKFFRVDMGFPAPALGKSQPDTSRPVLKVPYVHKNDYVVSFAAGEGNFSKSRAQDKFVCQVSPANYPYPEIVTFCDGLNKLLANAEFQKALGITAKQVAELKAIEGLASPVCRQPHPTADRAAALFEAYDLAPAAEKATAEAKLCALLAEYTAEIHKKWNAVPERAKAILTPAQLDGVRDIGHGVLFLGGR